MASSPDCKIIIFVIELLVAMLHLIRMKEGLAELQKNMRCLFVNFRCEDFELNDEISIAQYESWFTLKSLRTLPFPRQSAVRGFGETGRESGPLASET